MASSSSSALRGAHLAESSAKIGEQPSIFDIISQESLMKALKPAGRHLFRYLSLIHPQRFSTAHRNYDELYALFDLLLQNHFLSRYGASFSENFYGMKRVGGSGRIRNLLVLVGWPYLRDKLDALFEKLKNTIPARSQPNESWRRRVGRAFLAVYPYLKAALSAWSFILQAGYICSWTNVHSPFLLFSGVRLEKLTPADLAKFEGVPLHLQPKGFFPRLWRLILSLPGVFSRLFAYGLFFVQFLDFLHNSEAGSKLGLGNSLTAWKPPVAPHKELRESAVQQLETHKCPICLRTRENDTVLAVSGYVFCYSCIHEHLQIDPRCPVTGLPATTTQLIRLYLSRENA